MSDSFLADAPSKKFSRSTYEVLYFAYKPFAGRLLVFLGMGFLGRILVLSNANLIGKWVDRGLPDPQGFIVLLFLLCLGGLVLTWIYRVGFSRYSAAAISSIYDEITLRTSRYPQKFFDNNPSGKIITRFASDYGNVFRMFGGPLAEFLSIVFDLIVIGALMIWASPWFVLVVALIFTSHLMVFKWNQGVLRDERRKLSSARSPGVAHFAETVMGASAIRSFNQEHAFSARFYQQDDLFLKQKRRTFARLIVFSSQMNFLTIGILAIAGVGCYLFAEGGGISAGSIGVLFGFILFSGNTIQMFFDWVAQFEEALVGVERLNSYLRKPMEPGARLPAGPRFATSHPVDPSPYQHRQVPQQVRLEFDGIWLKYSDDQDWVLQDISFVLEPGEKMGIIGRTGSGKSSIIQCLFSLYPPQRGQIRWNGQSLTANSDLVAGGGGLDLRDLRNWMSYIPQEPVLFSGTVRLNLDPRGAFTDLQLTTILSKVGLHFLAHVQGLAFPLVEGGRNLSLGERQLLCLARSLVHHRPLLVMDEATSSVDSHSEELMVRAAQDLFQDKSQLLIAHRLSSLQYCDKILWIEKGRIRQMGPRDQVLAAFHGEAY